MNECIGCGEETIETVPGQIGDLVGVLCTDCQVWCDGNIAGPTVTLVSACVGDHVDGVDFALLADPAWQNWTTVQWDFMRENGYGPDNPSEVMYVLTPDQVAPEGFPALRISVTEAQLTEVTEES